MMRLVDFQNHLTDLGLNVVSVEMKDSEIAVFLTDGSTPEQQALANAEALKFDFRNRETRVSILRTWYQNLTAADKNKLLGALAVQLALSNPELIDALGIPFPLDTTQEKPSVRIRNPR